MKIVKLPNVLKLKCLSVNHGLVLIDIMNESNMVTHTISALILVQPTESFIMELLWVYHSHSISTHLDLLLFLSIAKL